MALTKKPGRPLIAATLLIGTLASGCGDDDSVELDAAVEAGPDAIPPMAGMLDAGVEDASVELDAQPPMPPQADGGS